MSASEARFRVTHSAQDQLCGPPAMSFVASEPPCMGLFDFLIRLFFPKPSRPVEEAVTPTPKKPRRRPRLVPLRATASKTWTRNATLDVKEPPYAFARLGIGTGRFLDLSQDGDEGRLANFALPAVPHSRTIGQLAGNPLGPAGVARPSLFRQLETGDRGRSPLSLSLAGQTQGRPPADRIAEAHAQRGAAENSRRDSQPARRRIRRRTASRRAARP